MNRSGSKDLSGVSLTSTNGTTRISNTSLMTGNGQILYRRSPIPQLNSNQPLSFDTIGSPSTTSYTSEDASEPNNSFDEDNVNDLSFKFDQLQRQIELLNETQSTHDERYKRSRQENEALLNRIHCLEDQLRELELNSESRAREDEKRFKETMAKQLLSRSQECEQHLHANFQLQQELFSLKNDLLNSETLIKVLRGEKESLETELQEKNSELVTLDEEIHKLKLLVKNLKDEENIKSNLISILNEELEDSQNRSHKEQQYDPTTAVLFNNNPNNQSPKQNSSSSRRSSVTSGFEDNIVSSAKLKDIDGLEMSLNRLRDENKRLRESNEELQAQLLNLQLEEGRSLVQEGNKSYSLADELGDIDVQRLMKAFKEQQEVNARLRKYIDEIILKIVENNPEILDKTLSSDKNHSDSNKATNSSD